MEETDSQLNNNEEEGGKIIKNFTKKGYSKLNKEYEEDGAKQVDEQEHSQNHEQQREVCSCFHGQSSPARIHPCNVFGHLDEPRLSCFLDMVQHLRKPRVTDVGIESQNILPKCQISWH